MRCRYWLSGLMCICTVNHKAHFMAAIILYILNVRVNLCSVFKASLVKLRILAAAEVPIVIGR